MAPPPSPSPPTQADLGAARRFLAGHARVLDRCRFDLLLGDGDVERTLAALDAYRNPDGGYGHGLEPDLRAPGSQPAPALHAFEVLAEVAPTTSPHAAALCDWLDGVTLAGGLLPFALPIPDPTACSPVWTGADPTAGSLQITAAVLAHAHRVARHDPAVAAHPWVARATQTCLRRLDDGPEPTAYERLFALLLVDALAAREGGAPGGGLDDAAARARIDRLVAPLVEHGTLPVEGGLPGEGLDLLEAVPRRGAVRDACRPEAVDAALGALAAAQQPDGGWEVDFATASPAAALEWRGYATVRAVATLLDAGAATAGA
jgi:hypothetical protein